LKYFGIYLNCGVDTLKKTDEPVKLTGFWTSSAASWGFLRLAEIGNATRIENDIVDFAVAEPKTS
jgi:hypothetical protein